MLFFPFPITEQVNRKWKKPPATVIRYLQRWQNDQYSLIINTEHDHNSTNVSSMAKQNSRDDGKWEPGQTAQSHTCIQRSDFSNGCCSTEGHSGASYCTARVLSWCFSRNVTASTSTENLAHTDDEITARQLMCQLHKNTIPWTLNSHPLKINPPTDPNGHISLNLYT